MTRSSQTKALWKYTSLFSALCFNFVRFTQMGGFGCTYGSLLPYIYSYFHAANSSLKFQSLTILSPIFYTSMALGTILSSVIKKYLGLRSTLLTGTVLISLSFLIGSISGTASFFSIMFPLIEGFATSLLAITSAWPCQQYFPANKGLILGAIFSSSYAGGMFFTFLIQQLMNPDSLQADHLQYPVEVYSRFPRTFQIIGAAHVIIGLVASIIIRESNTQTQTQKKRIQLFSWNFFYIFLMTTASYFWFSVMMMTWKAFGTSVMDETSLSVLGMVANIAGILGGLFWPYCIDWIGFKKTLIIMLLLTEVVICTIEVPGVGYAVNVCVDYFVQCSVLACVAAGLGRMFGGTEQEKLFPYVYIAMCLGAYAAMGVEQVVPFFGYWGLWGISLFIVAVGLFAVTKIKENRIVKEIQLEEQLYSVEDRQRICNGDYKDI